MRSYGKIKIKKINCNALLINMTSQNRPKLACVKMNTLQYLSVKNVSSRDGAAYA